MINLSKYVNFNGQKVKVVDVDNKTWIGIMTIGSDYDTGRSYIYIEQCDKNYIIELQEDEIKSIEFIS